MKKGTFEPAGKHRATAPSKIARGPGALDVPVATVAMAGLLSYAWMVSGEAHLTAETGPGYYLGIAGSVMMLLLLIYPLRKRIRALKWIGTIPGWFRIHMIFGVVGPSLVVLHSNFTLGSVNSQVAMFSMLIVAGSGFVGRFLYRRIHRGVTGRKRTAAELRESAVRCWAELHDQAHDTSIEGRLIAFEHRFVREERSLLVALARVVQAGRDRRAFQSEIEAKGRVTPQFQKHLDAYFDATHRTQTFSIYERLFSLWHLLHLPLFIILVAAALLHVLAVHLY